MFGGQYMIKILEHCVWKVVRSLQCGLPFAILSVIFRFGYRCQARKFSAALVF